jgi:L-ascorbate metabolism protein UlaG (beta-lactamase superfamily)
LSVGDSVRWIGHSTVLVELDGVRLLTDPLLRDRVVMLRRSEPLELEELEDLDAVLISHVHYDHLDLGSLRRLRGAKTIVVPRGANALLRRRVSASVHELGAGEEIEIGSVGVKAVHAEHDSARLLGKRTEALGYVVSGSSRVYFLGDTDLFPALAEVAPDTHVALVPIWGWGPSLGTGHLDPRRAAEAVALIRPRMAVPIHWGTYYPVTVRKSARDFLRTPVAEFEEAAAELAPEVDVRVLPLGGSLEL